jgi:hypothetical protein
VQVYVTNGTENSPAPYVLITNNPIILNVSDITFKLSNFVFLSVHQDLVLLDHPDQAGVWNIRECGFKWFTGYIRIEVVVQDLVD